MVLDTELIAGDAYYSEERRSKAHRSRIINLFKKFKEKLAYEKENPGKRWEQQGGKGRAWFYAKTNIVIRSSNSKILWGEDRKLHTRIALETEEQLKEFGEVINSLQLVPVELDKVRYRSAKAYGRTTDYTVAMKRGGYIFCKACGVHLVNIPYLKPAGVCIFCLEKFSKEGREVLDSLSDEFKKEVAQAKIISKVGEL